MFSTCWPFGAPCFPWDARVFCTHSKKAVLAPSGLFWSTVVRIVCRSDIWLSSSSEGCETNDSSWKIHFALPEARPIAPAIVEVRGVVKGTTNTVERSDDVVSELLPFKGLLEGVRTNIACVVPAPTSSRDRPFLSAWVKAEGIGRVWDDNTTEYCRSQSRITISRAGVLVIPANRTKDEPSESREISVWDFWEVPWWDAGAIAERDVKLMISRSGDRLYASFTHSSWKGCHAPDSASWRTR